LSVFNSLNAPAMYCCAMVTMPVSRLTLDQGALRCCVDARGRPGAA
jgi:hypothetical protein